MFLHLLNDTQQKAFLALAKQFIEADRHLADEEQNLLELMYAETGQSFGPADGHLAAELDRLFHIGDEDSEAPEAEVEAAAPADPDLSGSDIEDLASFFNTEQARSVVMLEIIGVGHADNDFSPEENEFVGRLASAFGMREEKVRAMESWVTRQLALAQEVEQFWAE